MIIYTFLLRFSSLSHKKEWYKYEISETILIVLITNTSHKAHLLSCALRCSSKLQEIQNLKNFISMAIQGTQVPIYTNTHYFCIFFLFLFWKTNKVKTKQPNKNRKTTWKYENRCKCMKAWFPTQIKNQETKSYFR